MKFFSSAVIASLLLIPQLVFATPVEGLLGRWKSQDVLYGDGVQFRIDFNFTPTKTTMNVNCFFTMGQRLRASATASTTYDVNNIFIREQKENVSGDGQHFCRASLYPAQWTAYFNGAGAMVLFVPTPYQAQFHLVPVTPAIAPLL